VTAPLARPRRLGAPGRFAPWAERDTKSHYADTPHDQPYSLRVPALRGRRKGGASMTHYRYILAAGLALVVGNGLAETACAEDDHQYYMYSPPRSPDQGEDQMFIIDQKTGDMWQYLSRPAVGRRVQGVSGIRYFGKLRVGIPGEAIIGNFGSRQ